jgi:hypothetical protein
MTFCRCHCRDCGSHFSSLEAFDHHHEGSGSTLVPCVFPGDAPLVEITGEAIAPSMIRISPRPGSRSTRRNGVWRVWSA